MARREAVNGPLVTSPLAPAIAAVLERKPYMSPVEAEGMVRDVLGAVKVLPKEIINAGAWMAETDEGAPAYDAVFAEDAWQAMISALLALPETNATGST